MSCLLEMNIPFCWSKIAKKDQDHFVIDFPMNHIAYTFLDQNDECDIKKSNEFDSDLHRLEYKVNLILQMLSQMMQRDSSLPARTTIRLGADEIAWAGADAQIGEKYHVKLYINEHTKVPIQTVVRITKIESGWCYGLLETQHPEEQSVWQRWVFRQHRRKIANARAEASA